MSQIWIIFFVIFVNMLGFGIIIPIGPTFQVNYELTAFQYGILGSIFPLMQIFASPILGRLSDRYGRRSIIIISFIFVSISYIVLAFANSFAMVITSRIIGGIFSGSFAVAMACAADISTKENRTKYMGIAGMGFGFGFMLGPTMGALFAGHNTEMANVFATSMFAFSFSIIGLILTILFLPDTNKEKYRAKSRIYTEIRSILVKIEDIVNFFLSGILSLVLAGLEVFLSLWLANQFSYDPFQIGIFWTLYAIIMNVGRIALIKVIRGELGIFLGFTIIGFGFIYFALTSSLHIIYASTYLIAIFAGILITVINSRISLNADPKQLGLFLGINNSAGNIGRMLGPFVMGYCIHSFNNNIHAGWVFVSIMCFIAALCALLLYLKEHHNKLPIDGEMED